MTLRRRAAIALTTALTAITSVAAAQQPGIEYAYDARGRLVIVANQQGDVAIYVYDAAGNVLAIRRVDAADLPGTVGISVVTPDRGKPGTVVSIFGKGFGPAASDNVVTFNGAPATVTAAAPNRLTVTVPPGATSGPLRVVAPLGTTTAPTPFRVLGAIAIDPAFATVGPGGTQQFAASQDGAAAAVLWAVDGVVGGRPETGSVSAEGLFVAPGATSAAPPAVTVTAIDRDDSTLTASAVVTLQPPRPVFWLARPISVGATPPPLSIDRNVTAMVSVTMSAPPLRLFAPALSVAPAAPPAFAVTGPVSIAVGTAAGSP
jgi:YD repeat-containing protein